MEFQKCGYDGINIDKETIEYLGLDKYYCPVMKNYSIYGAYYSDEFRYI